MGRERAKRKRDTEDHVTREARLKKNREAARERRANEALEQRLERLERNREQARSDKTLYRKKCNVYSLKLPI